VSTMRVLSLSLSLRNFQPPPDCRRCNFRAVADHRDHLLQARERRRGLSLSPSRGGVFLKYGTITPAACPRHVNVQRGFACVSGTPGNEGSKEDYDPLRPSRAGTRASGPRRSRPFI